MTVCVHLHNTPNSTPKNQLALSSAFHDICGLSNRYQSYIANKPNDVAFFFFLFFFYNRNFMSDSCILTNTKDEGGKKDIKSKKKPTWTALISIGTDTLLWQCGHTQVSPLSVQPHFEKYTLVLTHAFTHTD